MPRSGRRSHSPGSGRPKRAAWIRLCIALIVGAFLLAFDLARAPADQASARFLLGGIHFYQDHLRAPVRDGMKVKCRFDPSCSRYAEASIEKYGAGRGLGRSAWRILHCGPWTERGTVDPP